MKLKPKDEAKLLIDSFKDLVMVDYEYDYRPIFDSQKQCALIVVNKILNLDILTENVYNHYCEVKKEIEEM